MIEAAPAQAFLHLPGFGAKLGNSVISWMKSNFVKQDIIF